MSQESFYEHLFHLCFLLKKKSVSIQEERLIDYLLYWYQKKNALTSVRNSEERLIDAAFRCEVLSLIALLVQKYLLYWYKSKSEGRIMEAALRCEVYICPHAPICVLIVCVRYICVHILYICVLILQVCAHATAVHTAIYVSATVCMCVLIILYMCSHSVNICPHSIHVSAFYVSGTICVLIL